VNRLRIANPDDPHLLRELWCRLRRTAKVETFADRSLEIWNGLRESVLREDTNIAPDNPDISCRFSSSRPKGTLLS
jgi:hypothetical protein